MNRVAENIMSSSSGMKLPLKLSILVITAVIVGACSATSDEASPEVIVSGELATDAPASPTPEITLTPTATPLPTRTPIPTAPQVSVSRIDPDINPAVVTPIAEGAPLPDIALTTIDGETLQLADFEGKPLVLNFWSLGCGSCFYEFPLLQAFHTAHGDALNVVGINISDFAEETRIIAEQLGATFPQVVDQQAALFATYFNGAVVPTTIFINAAGDVSYVAIGPMDAYNINLQLEQVGLPSVTLD